MNNVNWYMLFKNNQAYEGLDKVITSGEPFTEGQIARAAAIVRGALEYNRLLNE
jgi:hypothetical protein